MLAGSPRLVFTPRMSSSTVTSIAKESEFKRSCESRKVARLRYMKEGVSPPLELGGYR